VCSGNNWVFGWGVLFTADAHRDNERDSLLVLMTMIEISPHRNGWKVFQAARRRACVFEERAGNLSRGNRSSFRSGEIRILDSSGNVEQTIPFTETDRRL